MIGHLGLRDWEGVVHSPGKFPMQNTVYLHRPTKVSRHKCTLFCNNNKHTNSPGNLHLSTVHTMIHSWHYVSFHTALIVWYIVMEIQNWSICSRGFPGMLQLCFKQGLLGKHRLRFSPTFTASTNTNVGRFCQRAPNYICPASSNCVPTSAECPLWCPEPSVLSTLSTEWQKQLNSLPRKKRVPACIRRFVQQHLIRLSGSTC